MSGRECAGADESVCTLSIWLGCWLDSVEPVSLFEPVEPVEPVIPLQKLGPPGVARLRARESNEGSIKQKIRDLIDQ